MFDGNGNWTSDFSAVSDRDNNIKILASRFDNIFIADIKESFENCLTKDGQIAPIGAFNMGGQKVTNLANGTNPNDAINRGQLDTILDNEVVKLSGAQTIAGVKTFSSSPVVPTPAVSDNSTNVANTAWVTSKVNAGPFPKAANRVNVVTSTSSSINTYTAPSNGVMYFDLGESDYAATITVDGYTMVSMRGHNGSSHGRPSPCATILVGKNQVVGWTANTMSAVRFVPFGE